MSAVEPPLPGQRPRHGRWLAIGAAGAMVAVAAAFIALREQPPPALQVALPAGGDIHGHGSSYAGTATRPALSAAEEAYAADLWKVHEQVKTSAVKMTFAGLSYKMGEIDQKAVRARVEPLTGIFRQARERAAAITPPANLATMHRDYVDALQRYEKASEEMVKIADDGQDRHLVDAQALTETAAVSLLKAGDALWPGEYKPN